EGASRIGDEGVGAVEPLEGIDQAIGFDIDERSVLARIERIAEHPTRVNGGIGDDAELSGFDGARVPFQSIGQHRQVETRETDGSAGRIEQVEAVAELWEWC